MRLRLLKLLFWKEDQLPVYLIHSVTERCNARCTHCFVDKDQRKPELTIAEIEELCASLGKNLYHVCLSGGEPFLRPDLAEIARAYYERTPVQVIRISTNGYLVERIVETTKAILALPSRRSLVVEISIDGVGETHNRIRVLDGLFERTVATYRQLTALAEQHENFVVNVNVTVCKSNQHELDRIYDYLRRELGIENISMTLTRGKPERLDELDVDIAAYERFAARVERDMSTQHLPGYAGLLHGYLVNAQNVIARRRVARTVRANQFMSRCYAGNLAGVLESDGRVRPCELRPEIFGNVRQRSFRDLWLSRDANSFKKTCDSCFCTHECFLASNIIFNPRYGLELGVRAAGMWFQGTCRRVRAHLGGLVGAAAAPASWRGRVRAALRANP